MPNQIKSNEDILADHGVKTLDDYNPIFENVKRAMDERAKQEAIAFSVWLARNDWKYSGYGVFITILHNPITEKRETAEQLYTLFLTTKS